MIQSFADLSPNAWLFEIGALNISNLINTSSKNGNLARHIKTHQLMMSLRIEKGNGILFHQNWPNMVIRRMKSVNKVHKKSNCWNRLNKKYSKTAKVNIAEVFFMSFELSLLKRSTKFERLEIFKNKFLFTNHLVKGRLISFDILSSQDPRKSSNFSNLAKDSFAEFESKLFSASFLNHVKV